MMGTMGALPGAILGTAIGMAVWIGVGLLGFEVGYIAWGIGLLSGLGASIGAGDKDHVINGVLAAILAILGVAAAKYMTISIAVDRDLVGTQFEIDAVVDDSAMIARQADSLMEADGNVPDETQANGYPKEYLDRATEQWNSKSEDEKQSLIAEVEAEYAEFRERIGGDVAGQIKMRAFKESFDPFDALWFFLAAATAYRVGCGSAGESAGTEE